MRRYEGRTLLLRFIGFCCTPVANDGVAYKVMLCTLSVVVTSVLTFALMGFVPVYMLLAATGIALLSVLVFFRSDAAKKRKLSGFAAAGIFAPILTNIILFLFFRLEFAAEKFRENIPSLYIWIAIAAVAAISVVRALRKGSRYEV